MSKKQVNKVEKSTAPTAGIWAKYRFELIIAAVCVLLYAISVRNNYNMDDELVTINHKLTSKGISAIPEIFTSPYYSDESGYSYEYRPVVLATYAIEHSIFGDNPHVSHFFNLLLYTLCCIVLYKLLLNVFSGYSHMLILAITLIFTVHPAHTEVVCSAKNRDEILGLIFCLLSLNFALNAIKSNKLWKLVFTALLFAFGLMCKITFFPFSVISLIALLLFSQIGLYQTVLVAFAYILPLHFILDVSGIALKATIEVSILAGSIIFYYIIHPEALPDIKSIKSGFDDKSKFTAPTDSSIFSGFQGFFTQAVFPLNFIISVQGAICLLLAVTYMVGLYTDHRILLIIPIVTLVVLMALNNYKFEIMAKLALYTCFIASTVYLPIAGGRLKEYEDTLRAAATILLSYEIFFGKPYLRLPAITALLTLLTLVLFQKSSTDKINYIFTVAFFAALRYKKWYPGYAIILLTIIATAINTIQLSKAVFSGGARWYSYYPYIGALPLIAATLLPKYSRYFILFFVVIWQYAASPLSPGYFNYKPETPLADYAKQAAKNIDVKIYTGKTDRPLAYLESPINSETPVSVKSGTSLHILFHYLYKVVMPYPMAFYYGYKFVEPEDVSAPIPIISLALHIALLVVALLYLKRNKLVSFGVLLYLISIVIYSNYMYPVPGLLADRFLIVPSVGWSILIVTVLFGAFKLSTTDTKLNINSAPANLKYSLLTLLVVYSVITFGRTFSWKDRVTLMRNDIGYVHQSAQAHNLLALNIMKSSAEMPASEEQARLWNEALDHFKKSLEIYPGTFNVAFDIGRVYGMLDKPDSSLHYFLMADSIDPKNDYPLLKQNIATLYQQLGQNTTAIPYYEQYNKLMPGDFEGYHSLGFIYFSTGNRDKALEISKKATVMLPNDFRGYFDVARSYVEANKPDSALMYLYKSQQLNPNDAGVKQAIETVSQQVRH